MSYEVLARKWRPQIFQDVIGQEHITRTLINAIKSDRLAHAYLFSGARGVGKTSIARILAKAINCAEGEPGIPCNKCRSCIAITDGSAVDVQEIDGASNRGIEEIRELRENIKYMPASCKFRVYIIDEVHMLTIHAFNALLKTLEEPPPHVKFFFATTDPHKVPVTILSRCQKFDLKRIPLGKILQQLERISEKEKFKISKSGMTMIAREAKGSMRDAESLLDQVLSYSGAKVEDKDITDILGIIDRDLLFETSLAIIEGRPEKCIEIIDRIYNFGYDVGEFYRALMDQFRNLLISLVAPDHDLLDMTESDREAIKLQAEKAGREKLQQSLTFLITREEDVKFSSHPRLVLEIIMIKLSRLGDVLSFDKLIEKIEALEKALSSSPSSTNEIPLSHIADPGITWDKEEQPQQNREIVQDDKQGSRKNQEWPKFIEYLSKKNNAMAGVLKDWRLVDLKEDTARLECTKSSFSSNYFDEPDRLEKLEEYVTNFFQRKIKVKIVKNAENKNQKTVIKKKEPPTIKKEKYPDLSPPVQSVLDMFQGEIKNKP